MFESIVTTILNKFLGDYVANLERNQLNLGIFSGNVVLTDLQLKKEALDNLNLPIEVFHGHLGRLELHIPWRNLKSEPVKVVIEDLFLLAGPRVEIEYDPKVEQERMQKVKLEMLETAELFQSSSENKLATDLQNESFTTQLVTKIVDNLQVVVNNIHIRFEDSTSNSSRLFSFGITLKSLSAASTDEDWNETFLVNPQDAVHKLVSLDSFSMYWNTREEPLRDLSYEKFIEVARETIGDDSHAYILKPVSGVGKAILNKLFKEGVPKTMLNIFFDAFGINVNYEQYYDILCALAALSTAKRALPYRKYRPTGEDIKPVEFFRFAGTCFQAEIHEKIRRRTWAYIMQRRSARKEYVNLYSNKLILGTLNAEDAKQLSKLELTLELEDIMHYRKLAKAFAKRSQADTPKSYGSRMLGWLGFKESAKSDLVKEEDIRELYETIDFDASAQGQENLPPETQMLKLNFELGEGSFSLSEEPSSPEPMASVIFTNLTASFVQRPSTIAFAAALKELVLVENLIPDSRFKELIKVKPAHPGSPTSEKPLLYVSYDQMAKNPDADAEVYLAVRPLQVVVNFLAADKLVSFLLNKNTLPLLDALQAEAKRTFETIGIQTRASMQKALEEHKGIDLKVKLDAPVVLFPEDPTDLTKGLFVADLGKIKADTELVSAEEKKSIFERTRLLTDEETEELHHLLYDKIKVRITQLAVYFTENVSSWWEMSLEPVIQCAQASTVLEQVDINLEVETSIMPSATNLAKIKVRGVIPELLLYLSDRKIGKALSLLKQLPEPKSWESSEKSQAPVQESNGEKPGSQEKKKVRRASAEKSKNQAGQQQSENEEFVDEEFYDALDDMSLDVAKGNMATEAVKEEDPLLLLANIVIQKIRILVSENVDARTESKVLSLVAEDTGLRFTSYGTLNNIDFHLGSLALRDYLVPSEEGNLIIDGAQGSDRNLLNLSLRIVSPLNRDFDTEYNGLERLISIDISSFDVFADPEVSYGIATFMVKKMLPLLSEDEAPVSRKPSGQQLSLTEDLLSYQPKTRLSFGFSSFSINLLDKAERRGVLAAENFTADLLLAGKKLVATGAFLSLSVEGLFEGDYRKILYFEGDSVLNFSFETHCQETESRIAGANLFDLASGQMCVSADADVLASVLGAGLKFLRIAELMDSSSSGGSPSSDSAAVPAAGSIPGGSNEQKEFPITYLNVHLKSPVIMVPSADQSLQLGLDLGSLSLHNNFTKVTEGLFDQVIEICLQDTGIFLVEEGKSVRFILEKFSVPLLLRLACNSKDRNFANVEVDSKIDSISAGISRADFLNIMSIVEHVSKAALKLQSALPKPQSSRNEVVLKTRLEADAEVEAKRAAAIKKAGDGPQPQNRISDQRQTQDQDQDEDQDEDGFFPLDVKVILPCLRFMLKDSDDRPKVELLIEGVSATVVSHSQRGMGIEVAVESVAVSDLADPGQYYKDLFCIGKAAEGFNEPLVDSGRQLLVRLDQALDGASVINVYVESPRLFVLFDTIFYLQAFFTADSTPKKFSSPTPPPAHSTAPSASKMQVLFNMVDATILIVESPVKMETEAVALRVGSVAFNMSRDIVVAVDEISCFVFSTANPETSKVDLIEDLSATVAVTNDPQVEVSYLDVTLQPLSMTISFQDLQLFQSFADSATKAQTKYATKDLDSPAEEVRSPNPASRSSKKREKGLVNIHGIQAVLIDDSTSTLIPLMDFSVEGISCLLENWSSAPEISVAATIKAHFYNPSLSYWEPLIEPWNFCVKVGPSDFEPTAENVILLASEKGIEVLGVQHSIERLLQMLQKLSVKSPKSHRMSRKLSSPYIFTNLLESSVHVNALSSIGGGGCSSPSSPLALQPGERAEFAFEDWKHSRTAMINSSHRIKVAIGEFAPLSTMKVDQDGFQRLKLELAETPDSGTPSSEAYMQTYLEEGVRHIVFREADIIENCTVHQLLVFFEGTDNGKTVKLSPGGKICVPPAHVRSKCSLMVGESNTRFTNSVDLSLGEQLAGTIINAQLEEKLGESLSSNTDSKGATGRGKLDEKSLFNVMITCKRPALGKTLDICLIAPSSIENLLPVPIQIKLAQNDRKALQDIQGGDLLSVYDVDPTMSYTIAASIPSAGLFSTNECLMGSRNRGPSVLTLQDEAGLELKLLLNETISHDGKACLSVAAFYVIINQTEMTLQVQSDTYFKNKRVTNQIFTVPPSEDGKPYALFSHPDVKSVKNRVRLRIADSDWSDAISFEAVGAECELSCKSMLTEKWYNISGYVSLGSGKYAASKVIYISSRFFAVNDTDWTLYLSDSHSSYCIPPKSQIPFNIDPSHIDNILVKRDSDESWMAPFEIRNIGNLYLTIPSESQKLIRVGRSVKKPHYYLSFSCTESWPYTIHNRSTVPLKFHQKNVGTLYACDPHTDVKYTWDQPSFNDKRLLLTIADKESSLDLAEIGRKSRFKIKKAEQQLTVIDVEIKAQGPAVVICVSERRIASEARFDAKDTASEEASNDGKFSETFQSVVLLRIPYIAVSLLGKDLEEFLLVYVKGLEVRYAVSEQFVSYGLTVKWLQIDNQCFDYDHPMLLYPAVLSKSTKELESHPFLSLGIIQSKDSSYGVTYYKYFGLLLQEMAIEVGEELLRRVLGFVDFSLLSVQRDCIIDEQDFSVSKLEMGRDSSDVLFFEFFQMHPIKVSVTFSRTEGPAAEKGKATFYNPMATLVDVLTMTIGNISDAPLKFNALVLENILARQSAIQETVIEHYKQECLTQVHKVIGSADFLGNPVGLVSTLGSGVTDLFYEPYQGLVSDRPQDVGIGLARGGISLARKTISGFTGTFSKFTGSLAKGLSAATLDTSYQQRRRTAIARNKPKHALSGVSTGASQLYSGFKSGITGVVDKPLEGAKEGGIGGFFKGVGVGLVGAVTKPVVGLIDMTTSFTEGIKNTADDSSSSVTQVRFPRVVPWDGKIHSYDMREAFGQSIMVSVSSEEQVVDEFYVAHLDIPGENSIVILTSKRLELVSVDRIKIVWATNIEAIQQVTPTIDSIIVRVFDNPPRIKVIPIMDKITQKWFVDIINQQLSQLLG